MARIVVIGNSGGGKSVLARRLATKYGLPYVEIDALLWRPGWRLASAEEYAADHARWISEPSWVMDGLGRRDSIPARLARATDIILVDLPLWIHFSLAGKRQIAWAMGRLEYPPAGSARTPPIAGLFKTISEVNRDWIPDIREWIGAEEARGKRIRRIQSIKGLHATGADWKPQ